MIDILVSAITVVLAGCALGYSEVKGWSGFQRIATYAAVGLITAELAAMPLFWQLFGLRGGAAESLFGGFCLTVALLTWIDYLKRWM